MLIEIKAGQFRKVSRLIRRECCNCMDGNCLLLDDGETHTCVQLISKYHIFPLDKELYRELICGNDYNHPFTVADNEDMAKIVESIGKVGTITPLLARPLPDGGYELISGHRRLEACRKLGFENIPVIVREMTDDEAVIAMVDANLQREHILPSEKAFAYKMKLEAMKDEERIAFSVGVELSYLSEYEQQDLLEAIELEDKTP